MRFGRAGRVPGKPPTVDGVTEAESPATAAGARRRDVAEVRPPRLPSPRRTSALAVDSVDTMPAPRTYEYDTAEA